MKALILTTHTGGGHDAAAKAMEEALTSRGVVCKVMDCLAFGGLWFSKAICKSYVKTVQISPNTFGRVYRLGEMLSTPRWKSPIYMMNATYARRMRKTLEAFNPDMVVCTHEFGGQTMTWLRRHEMYSGLLCVIMTDYTFIPFLEDCEPDVLIVSHHAVSKEAIKKRVGAEKLYPYGIPVSLGCKPCANRLQAKRDLGLDTECKELLLVGGSMGAGNLPETVGALLPLLGEKVHLTLVCGSNEKARSKAEELFGDNPYITVKGRVAPLYPNMSAADVVITKSGGLTTTEAMTIGVPLVIVHPIRGCETANVDLFESYGMATHARNLTELPQKVQYLLENPEAAAQMVEVQRREINPNCAMDIADLLMQKVEERKGE